MAARVPQLLCEIKKHPFISCSFLLLFTPPVFPVVVFFSPLILSTALCALALVSFTAHFAPASAAPTQQQILKQPQQGIIKAPPHDSLDAVIKACREETTWLEWFLGQHHPHHRPLAAENTEDSMHLGACLGHSRGDMGMFSPSLVVPAEEKEREGNGAEGDIYEEGREREGRNAGGENVHLGSAGSCKDAEEVCEGAHESAEGNVGAPTTPQAEDDRAVSVQSKKEHEAGHPEKEEEGEEEAEGTGLRFSFFDKHAVVHQGILGNL